MASSTFFLVFILLLLAWILYVSYCLAVNYSRARKIGLPIVILPIDSGNPLWMSVDTRILPLLDYLPFKFRNFRRFSWRGWEIQDRSAAHQELGDAFIFVTPGNNWLQVCNTEAMEDIFRNYTRPTEMLEMLNIFGPNLGTTEGQQWQRHRKITAACFNEHTNKLVWSESINQATDMARYWSSKPSINSVADDARTVSLHIMSSAAFGKSYPFQGSDAATTHNSQDYKESLKLILDNCIPLVAVGSDNLNKWWLLNSWKDLYQATVTFRNYMTTAYEQAKQEISQGKKVENNLMTALVRASSVESDIHATGKKVGGLTEKEIYGNIFVFNFAGHDTTANSLAFGIALIATRPDIQEWISEEIDLVFGENDTRISSYSEVFPRLKRCLAVVVSRDERISYSSPRTNDGVPSTKQYVFTHMLPPHTMIIPSYSALHTHPRYWGADSLDWEPKRWIDSASTQIPSPAPASNKTTDAETLASESFFEFPKAANPFVAWSGGARICPGKKFSQVEFVGVLVGLFREYRARPLPQDGEDDAAAIKRLKLLIKEDAGMRLLLQLMHPEKAVLKWEKRT